MPEKSPPRRRKFQFSLATLISFVIFVNLGFAIWYTWDNYRYPPPTVTFRSRNVDEGVVMSAAFSPDGRRAIAGYSDGTIRIWDVTDGREIARKTYGENRRAIIGPIAVSSDGRRVLYVYDDFDTPAIAVLWDMESGETLRELPSPYTGAGALDAIALSHDGRLVVWGGTFIDKSFIVWDLETGEISVRFTDPAGSLGINHLAFSQDDRRIISIDIAGQIRFWDIESGSEDSEALIECASAISAAVSHDGRLAAIGGSKDHRSTFQLLDLNERRIIAEITDHGDGNGFFLISDVHISRDGRRALYGGWYDKSLRGVVHIIDTGDGRELHRIGIRFSGMVRALAPDGRSFLAPMENGGLGWWDLEAGRPIWPLILSIAATIAFALFVIVMKIRARRKARAAASAEGDAHA